MNIDGVTLIDSGIAGPTVAITACTHGNEPAGMVALKYASNLKIKRGKLYLIVVNYKARQMYLCAKNNGERAKTRFVDINFNRLPINVLDLKNDSRYEIQRLHELLPVFEQFDYSMDLHSTSQQSPPMFITENDFNFNLVRGIPVEILLAGIDEIQVGVPSFIFHGSSIGNRFEIELGAHESKTAEILAVKSAERFLINTGIIDGAEMSVPNIKKYKVIDSLMFPNRSYSLVRIFAPFERIKRNQALACGYSGDLVANEDCQVIFGLKRLLKPNSINEEVLFMIKENLE